MFNVVILAEVSEFFRRILGAVVRENFLGEAKLVNPFSKGIDYLSRAYPCSWIEKGVSCEYIRYGNDKKFPFVREVGSIKRS